MGPRWNPANSSRRRGGLLIGIGAAILRLVLVAMIGALMGLNAIGGVRLLLRPTSNTRRPQSRGAALKRRFRVIPLRPSRGDGQRPGEAIHVDD